MLPKIRATFQHKVSHAATTNNDYTTGDDDQDFGNEEDDDGDPPRLWAQGGNYPGTAFTRSLGDFQLKDAAAATVYNSYTQVRRESI